jgi:hypothetical protein
MKKSLRLMTALILIVFAFAMNTSAITIIGGSTTDKIESSDWTEAGTVGFSKTLDTPIDVSGMENLYFRVYVDNVDNLTAANNGQLELTSGGTCDVEESNINPLDLDWKNGWNEFVVPISDFVGSCDLTRLNYVRLYMFTSGLNCSVLDYIAVGNSADDQSVLVKNDWTIPTKPDANAVKPDVVTLDVTGKGAPWTAVLENAWGTPIDLSKYESAYIGIYVSDMDKFAPDMGSGQIEFGSAYVPDAEEDMIDVNTLGLVTGWNYIEIPLSSIAAGCDYTQFDHFRLYMFFNSPDTDINVKLDYVAFGPAGMDVAEGKASTFPYVLIKPLADRDADAAAAAATAEAAGGTAETAADGTAATTSTSAPATADFGIAASAVLFAAACITIGVLRKRK